MNPTQLLWTLVAAQLILIGLAWTAAIPISRGYRGGIVGLVAFNLVLGLSLLLIALRGDLPYFVGHTVSNFLSLWAMVAIIQGGSQLLKFRLSQAEIWVVMTAAGLGILTFGVSETTSNWRALVLMLAVSWLLGRTGLKILRVKPEPHLRGPVKSVGFISLAIAALLFIRAVAGVVQQESIEFNAADGLTVALPYVVLVGASLVNLAFAYLTISTVVMTLHARAHADELTGLLNRKSITEEMGRAWKRFAKTRQPFAVIALDIDNLHSVNVTHGYPMGDALLAEIAKSLRDVLQPADVLGRAGGGKMIGILPNATPVDARVTAERMRGQVADMQHLFADERVKVSASLGVALSDATDTSEEAVLARANAQLERAKAGGRNRVEIESKIPPAKSAGAGKSAATA